MLPECGDNEDQNEKEDERAAKRTRSEMPEVARIIPLGGGEGLEASRSILALSAVLTDVCATVGEQHPSIPVQVSHQSLAQWIEHATQFSNGLFTADAMDAMDDELLNVLETCVYLAADAMYAAYADAIARRFRTPLDAAHRFGLDSMCVVRVDDVLGVAHGPDNVIMNVVDWDAEPTGTWDLESNVE